MGHVATVRVEKQACSGSAPRMDRRQRRVFVREQGEAVLALKDGEQRGRTEGQRKMHRDREREREEEAGEE